MSTGYTNGVGDGKITEFKEFALLCARAIDHLITMRDEPFDKEIPERFEPSQWNKEHLAKDRSKMFKLEAANDEQCEELATAEYEKTLDLWHERRREGAEKKRRYESMLEKIERWKIPTKDHDGLADFMNRQLRESIKHDCNDDYDDRPVKLDGNVWKHEKMMGLRRDIEYHTKEQHEEEKRTASRNKWLSDLRNSL